MAGSSNGRFIGKLIILNIVIDNNLFFVAVIAVLTSVIAAFYYIRLIKSIFDDPLDELDNISNHHSRYMLCGFAFFNLTVVFYPQFFLNVCASITLSLFAVKKWVTDF